MYRATLRYRNTLPEYRDQRGKVYQAWIVQWIPGVRLVTFVVRYQKFLDFGTQHPSTADSWIFLWLNISGKSVVVFALFAYDVLNGLHTLKLVEIDF